ncbi:hypothetical protein [Candidatus Neptunichlamydia sp. REUL1]|uniref:hypothetical protein n=1 Tax=Candidatus Neptunichlamydia sp. REUL1 TaxID=3064277 RepID=UPI00292E6DFF|nr:hypothetical protein [Candidatus Neptunochlamydia sp. REUL1]
MEATSQTNNHGCFWYLSCCCLCDSGEDTTQQQVATAADPLLNHDYTQSRATIAPRQVTFDSSRSSPPIEQMPVVDQKAEEKTPLRSPGSDRSFGSNPNSPADGQTATVDCSRWRVVKGTSSPAKKRVMEPVPINYRTF